MPSKSSKAPNIRRRGASSWEIRWYEGVDPATGKKRYRTRNIKGTLKDAQAALTLVKASKISGTYTEPSAMKVSDGLESWLAHVEQHVARKTFQEYRKIIRNYLIPTLGKHRLDGLKASHIQSYYDNAKGTGKKKGVRLSPQTVKHHHRVLKQALQYLVDMELMVKNPAQTVRPPKVQSYDAETLSPEEIASLLNSCRDSSYYIPILIAICTGFRRGEVLGLKWEDVDFERKTISVERSLEETKEFGLGLKTPKTKSSRRVIPVGDYLLSELSRHRASQEELKEEYEEVYEDQGLICANPTGGFTKPGTLSKAFHKIVIAAGVKPIRYHDLRHSHLTALVPWVPMRLLMDRAGHSTFNTTANTYTHPDVEMGRPAADQFDQLLITALEGKAA